MDALPRRHETCQTHCTNPCSRCCRAGGGVGVHPSHPPKTGVPAAAFTMATISITLVAVATHPQNDTHTHGGAQTHA